MFGDLFGKVESEVGEEEEASEEESVLKAIEDYNHPARVLRRMAGLKEDGSYVVAAKDEAVIDMPGELCN